MAKILKKYQIDKYFKRHFLNFQEHLNKLHPKYYNSEDFDNIVTIT